MLDLRLEHQLATGGVLALPVTVPDGGAPCLAADVGLPAPDLAEITAFLADIEHTGTAGSLHVLPRPTRDPRRVLLFGIGAGDERDWRSAGAALARSGRRDPTLTVALGSLAAPQALRGVAEGLWLADYQYRVAPPAADDKAQLGSVVLLCSAEPAFVSALARARVVCTATYLARDLTNAPSDRKTPIWFAAQVAQAAAAEPVAPDLTVEAESGVPRLTVEVWDVPRLEQEGLGGVLAVGRGSVNEPRLAMVSWNPPKARRHIVLVGKGVTFDTGGIVLKPRDSMKLMRKDMGGAATVVATTLAAAALGLPVRVTALAPLAENAIGADAYRPGDVIRHRGGITTEVMDTDAEGRLVLADALAYAADALAPDILIDLGTLTGAQNVALGKRTSALFSTDDELAGALSRAATDAGEAVWRLPLVEEYVERLDSDVADLSNAVQLGGGGCVTAALFLREFTGAARAHWAHLDMSAPAWSDSAAGDLCKGATGWGVRTLLRWLESQDDCSVPN